MLKNKRGFTFIEILAAITILGILTGVAVVAVSGVIENGKNEHYETAENNLVLAGQSYVQTNRAALPKAIGQKTKIPLATLVEKNYIQPIKDYSDNNCDLEDSYVQVFKYSQKDYSYIPVLKCGTDGNVYDGTKNRETTYDPEITAQIVVDEEKSSAEAQVSIQGNDKLMAYSYIVYRGSKEVKNSGSVSVKGFKESVTFKIPLTEYTPGILKVVIHATNIYGNDDKITVTKTVKDTKPPTCIIKLEDETSSPKQWIKGSRKITVGCDDGDGSGCQRETYTKTFRETTKDGEIIISDDSGNTTKCNVSVYIDNTAPSCTNTGDSRTWINTNRTIKYGCKDGNNESGCDPKNSGGERVFSSTTKTASISSYTIKDKVGNTKTCPTRTANVYVDKTDPGCTQSGGSTNWTNGNRTISYGCSDSDSGCNTSYDGGSQTFTSTTKTETIAAYTVKDIAGNTTRCPSKTANVYVDKIAPSCTNSGDSTKWTNSNRTISYGCSDSDSGCNTSYDGGSKTFSSTTKTSSIAAYTIKDKAGNTKTCPARTANVYVDKTDPDCTQSGGSTNWTNGNRTINYGCSDSDSGCNTSYDGGSQTFTSTAKTETIAAYTVKDIAGNTTKCPSKTANVYIDKTAPSCTNSGDSTSWTNSNRKINYGCSDSHSGCNTSYDGGSQTFSSTTKTASISSYTIKDKVGNSKTCAARTANVYVDKTDPTCTHSGDSTNWTSGNRTIYYGCSDSHSGCNTSYDGGSQTFSSTTKTSSIAAYTIKDKAGNSKSCSARTANVYVDKSSPSCGTISGASTSYTTGSRTVSVACSDTGSGCTKSSYSKTWSSGNVTTGTITLLDNVGHTKNCTVNVYRKNLSLSFSGYMGYWVAAVYKNDCSRTYRALNSSGNCILTYGNKYASNVIKANASKSGLTATFTWTVVNGARTYLGAGHYTNLILKNSSGTVLKKVAAKEPRNPSTWVRGGTYSGSFSYTFSTAGTYYLYMDGDTTDPSYDVTLGTITVS